MERRRPVGALPRGIDAVQCSGSGGETLFANASAFDLGRDMRFLYDADHPATRWVLGRYAARAPGAPAPTVSDAVTVCISVAPAVLFAGAEPAAAPRDERNMDEIILLEYEMPPDPAAGTPRTALGKLFGIYTHLATVGPLPDFPVAPGERQPELSACDTRHFAQFLSEDRSYRVAVGRLGKSVYAVHRNSTPSDHRIPVVDGVMRESVVYVVYDPEDCANGCFSSRAIVQLSSFTAFELGCKKCNPGIRYRTMSSSGSHVSAPSLSDSDGCHHVHLRGLKSFADWGLRMRQFVQETDLEHRWSVSSNTIFHADHSQKSSGAGVPHVKIKIQVPLRVSYHPTLSSPNPRADDVRLQFFERSNLLVSSPKIDVPVLGSDRLLEQAPPYSSAPASETGNGSESDSFRCRMGCDNVFGRAQERNRHENTVHRPRRFACSECGRRFQQHVHLKTHVSLVHRRERNFVCRHANCGQKFSLKQRLRAHEQREHGELYQDPPLQ